MKESGTGGEVNDIELAGGEEDRTQLRVPLVDHQTHNTGKWEGRREIITREKLQPIIPQHRPVLASTSLTTTL